MFAGAAREAVFSNPDVIRRINADFIPVALKAGLVNNPTDDEEGRLCREIGRSRPAPQGICVANSDGKALDWVLTFDGPASVVSFLEHACGRYTQFPDAKQPVPTERYMRFPSGRMDDAEDSGVVLPVPEHHTAASPCPAKALVPPGTLAARIYGRALDANGKPMSDTVRQEHYVEDRFSVSVELQEALAQAAAKAGPVRFRLSDALARLLVSHAYLGQLDVNPFMAPTGGRDNLKPGVFWAQKIRGDAKVPARLYLTGQSDIAGGQDLAHPAPLADGRIWRHKITLRWEGFIEMKGNRMTRMTVTARGSEKLQWGNGSPQFMNPGRNDLAQLPAGHLIDLACPVRYGILAEPAPPEEVSANGDRRIMNPEPGSRQAGPPADSGKMLIEMLGPQFAIFLPAVQSDLNLSQEQKQRLEQDRARAFQEFQQLQQEIGTASSDDRQTMLRAYHEEANRKQGALLAGLLNSGQRDRYRQIVLQQEGLFALMQPETAANIGLDDGQRGRLMTVLQEMQDRFQELQQHAQQSGRPDEMQQQAHRIRAEQETKLRAILSPAQQRHWQTLIGKPLKL